MAFMNPKMPSVDKALQSMERLSQWQEVSLPSPRGTFGRPAFDPSLTCAENVEPEPGSRSPTPELEPDLEEADHGDDDYPDPESHAEYRRRVRQVTHHRQNEMFTVPSLEVCADSFTVAVDPFSAVFDGPELTGDQQNEYWWVVNLVKEYTARRYDIHLQRLFSEIDGLPRTDRYGGCESVSYSSQALNLRCRRIASQEPGHRCGLSPQDFLELIDVNRLFVPLVVPESMDDYLDAEAFMLRLMLSISDHHTRILALDMWILVVARFCGARSVSLLAKLRQDARRYDPIRKACYRGDVVNGILSQITAHAQMSKNWYFIFIEVRRIRAVHWGILAWDHHGCPMHWDTCDPSMHPFVEPVMERKPLGELSPNRFPPVDMMGVQVFDD